MRTAILLRVLVTLSRSGLLGVLLTLGACTSAHNPGQAVFGVGANDLGVLQDENYVSPGVMLEARGPRVWKQLRPIAGAQYSARRSLLGYAGAAYDFRLARQLFLTPSFSVGAFDRGSGKEVGSTHQFRSALELAYERHNGHRVGLVVQHVSNGNTVLPNPGTEAAYLTYSIPIR